jgi:hypothetical protein
MKNNTGIFNSQNYVNGYMRSLRMAAFKSPIRFTIESYADKIAGRYEAMQTLIRGAHSFSPTLAAKGERLASEYETQLTMLADYADKLAEAGIA